MPSRVKGIYDPGVRFATPPKHQCDAAPTLSFAAFWHWTFHNWIAYSLSQERMALDLPFFTLST